MHPWLLRKVVFAISLCVTSFWYLSSHSAWELPGRLNRNVASNLECALPAGVNESLSALAATVTASHEEPKQNPTQPYAYVFYATTVDYACSVLINIARLQSFSTPHRIVVLVTPALPSVYLTAFTAQNATVVPYEPPVHPMDNGYYWDVFLKLVSFKLHHYIPSLQRILVLDADQLILQSLDHLFALPAVDVALPHAYWQEPGDMTSAMMLISLSDRLWNNIDKELHNVTADVFDMDIINRMFSKTALVLPGDYCTLNSHWETSVLPFWWRGEQPPERDPQWEPAPFEMPEPPFPNMTAKALQSFNHTLRYERERHAEAEELAERRDRTNELLVAAYNEVKVLHFTAVGKPWSFDAERIKSSKPSAHYLLAEQFGQWKTEANEVCPGMSDTIVVQDSGGEWP